MIKPTRARPRFHISRWSIVLLGAAALLLAACTPSAPTVAQDGVTPAPRAAPTDVTIRVPTIPAEWRTYTDAVLGYSLSYPEDVEFTSGVSKAGVYTARLQFTMPGVDGYQGMVLRVEPNPERRGIEQVAADLHRRNLLEEPPAGWVQGLAVVSVGGLTGVQLGQAGDFSLVVPYEDHVYIIAPVHDMALTALDPQALALFYQILATLRISP